MLIYVFIFSYIPMFGLIMSFQDYSLTKGIFGSKWVGLKNFKDFFGGMYFGRTLGNTLILSGLDLLVCFPAPIILALMLNEVGNMCFKRTIQTVSYMPHFISMVVVAGLIKEFCSSTGAVAQLAQLLGGEARNYLSDPAIPHHGLRLSDIIVPRCLPFTMIEITISAVAGLESAYMVLYAASVGIANIGWYFTVSAVTVALCRLFLGKVIDQKGTFTVFPGLGLMIVGLLILWLQQGAWMFALSVIVKTIGVNLAKPALQAASIKSVGAERRGAAVSTYYIGSDLGQGTSPMIAGRIVDSNGGNYGILFLIFALPLALAGLLFLLLSKLLKNRQTSQA